MSRSDENAEAAIYKNKAWGRKTLSELFRLGEGRKLCEVFLNLEAQNPVLRDSEL